jgi:hypothetical protein
MVKCTALTQVLYITCGSRAATRWHLLANQWRDTVMKIGLPDLSTDMASATEEK